MNKKSNKVTHKIKLKITSLSGKVKRYHTTKKNRFYSIIRRENFKNAYLKVRYGKKVNCFMKKVEFYNDGNYSNKEDLIYAFNAFISET